MTTKTFQYKMLTIHLHPEVYDPAEDTFLLLDSLQLIPGNTVLEIGTGCGIIALECARQGCPTICTDLNPYAISLTKQNIDQNSRLLIAPIEVREGNLFTIINNDEHFDIIIFNPPYLPTQPEEKIGGSGWFDLALNGGVDGLQTTRKFLETLSNHLKQKGVAYLVFSSLSCREQFEIELKKNGFYFSICNTCHFHDETLDVYKVNRQ